MVFRIGLRCLVCCALVFCVGQIAAQQASGLCGPAPVALRDAQPNIFTEQQEAWLGEAMADSLEPEIRPVRDPALSKHVQAIADRLLATLPATTIRFRVMLIESSAVNGFSIAGGHIYLTRKLAASAQNDDELAGVIGHEIGHIASHQFAFETTKELKRLLHVSSVGDRADVYAKYHALMDARMHDRHPSPVDTDDKQDEADRIGVYAEAAAGYRPEAVAEFWDRVFFVQGKTGGKLSDFFGITKPTQKRLRNLRALAATMPANCGGTLHADAGAFGAWHEAVVADQAGTDEAVSAALTEVTLKRPLRMELDQLRFSPDGKWILAQDESSVFVLSHEPLAVRFRIDASGALRANFSPDSKSVTFSTPGLHTEQWSIEDKKLIAAHELLYRDKCYETKLSPDGRSLLCVGLGEDMPELSLTLLDTGTGDVVWQKKNWATASYGILYRYFLGSFTGQGAADVLLAAYSSDNNVLLLGSGNNKVALDLRTRAPFKLGPGLQGPGSGEYAFVGADKVAMLNDMNPKQSFLRSFPEGKQLRSVAIPTLAMRGLTNPGAELHLLMFGDDKFDAAITDLGTSKFLAAVRTHAMDEYAGTMVAETENGGIALIKVGDTDLKHQVSTLLPLSPLSSLRAVALSPDGKYLAASSHYRGGIWDATTGKQMASMYGFTDATWTEKDTVYLEMAKQLGSERRVQAIDISARKGADLPYKLDDDIRMRYGRLTEWKEDNRKKSWTLTLHDPADDKVLWTRSFRDTHMGYSASYGDRDLLFSFGLKSNTAKDAIRANPKLAEQAGGIKNKDAGRLVEVLDAKSGEEAGSLILEVPPTYSGLDGVNRAGDLVYLTGTDDRTTVYSMNSGREVRKLFGVVMALDPATGRVCTANRMGEAVVYDADGKEIAHFSEGEPIRYAVFRQGAKVLSVLTGNQKLRTLPIDGAAGGVKIETASAQ